MYLSLTIIFGHCAPAGPALRLSNLLELPWLNRSSFAGGHFV